MSSFSLLSALDGLSPPPLKGQRSSWVGVVGSLLLVALLLWIFIPATQDYFSGSYYQSLFTTNANFTQPLYSRDDYKLALALRHKLTGALYDHQAVLDNLQAYLAFDNITKTYQEKLLLCQRDYFLQDINGVQLEDCLMVPDYAEFDAFVSGNKFSSLSLVIKPPTATAPFYSTSYPPSLKEVLFGDLLANYYCEFYFTSKVLTPSGNVQFQLHRAYSTQINVASDSLGANLQVTAGLRTTFMDDSIMPWRNNRNLTFMSYSGNLRGIAALTMQNVASGAQQTLRVANSLEVAVRFYKKLDWLLGVIGGGMFILFAIFWVVFSYYSRQAAQFELAQQLLLQKVTNDYPRSEEDLIPVKIPWYYMLRRLLPFCREEKYEILLEEAERNNDITLLLKKLKVARRNLARREMLPERHDSKIIDLPELDRINDEETSKEGSSQVQSQSQQEGQGELAYGRLPDESLVNVQLRQGEEGRPPVIDLDEEEISGEESNEEELAVQPTGEREKREERKEEREEGLGDSHHPFVEQPVAPQAPLIDLPETKSIPIHSESLPSHPQQDHAHPPHVHLPPVHPLHHLPPVHPLHPLPPVHPLHPLPPQTIIINNQLQLDLPPQQLIIIGTQEQIVEYNRNQQQQLPRDPSLLSDPQPEPLPATNAPSLRDDKFNLTSQQLTLLRTTDDPRVLALLENNPTFQAMREGKAACFPDLMELEEYDRWEGHYAPRLKKCLARFTSQLTSLITALDPFSVRVDLLDLSRSTTCCGVLLTLAIVILSILTFAMTIGNMSSTQFITSQNYTPVEQISFTRSTDNDFNAVVCINKPAVFVGGSRLATFTFFTNTSGAVQTYPPVLMTANDPALNLVGNAKFLPKALNLSTCFRMPMGIPVKIDGSGSHFGFSFIPYCGNTPSFCNSSLFTTNANFLTALTKNTILLFLPGSRLDPSSNTLFTDVFVAPYVNIDLIPITQNMTLQETIFANQVRLLDDTRSSFMRQEPPVKDLNINAGYNTRRPYVKAGLSTSPSYTYRIRLNQASTDYTVTQKKADWILGIIGGVCVFWYAVVHLLGKLYLRFNFNGQVAKVVYDEEGFDEGVVWRVLAMLPIPRCFLPRCLEIRQECDRMRAVDEKMQGSLTHLNLLKYTDNCFRLSSAFFSSLQAKNFSLLYFKEKIFDDEQVLLSVRQSEQPPQEELVDVDLRDELAMDKANQVTNSLLNLDSLRDRQGNAAFTKEELELAKLRVEHEGQWDHIIDHNPSTPLTHYLDLFPEPHSFSFRGTRLFSSITGGLCCLLMVLLVILVVVFQVSIYLNNAGVTTSYDISMDDGVNSTGITLTTGRNFKIAVAFLDVNTLQPVDPSPYLPVIGISILQQEFTRLHGTVVPNITVTDLQPCPSGYIESWMGPNIDASYFAGTGIAYCPHDGLVLSLLGQPDSLQFHSFKVSIYNRAGSASGQGNMSKLLNSTYVKLYFSSPRQNSISRTVDYEMESLVFGGLTALTPFQTNMTLSRSEVTYDDSHLYQSSLLNSSSYRFQPYNQQWLGYNYYGPATGSLWFNISFSNTFKLHSYSITAPKLYEAFGITGGVIAFFYCLIACFVVPFNRYKLRYEIGREIYHFDKRRITETKQKVKVKLRKNTSDRKLTQKLNSLSELRVLEAFLLRPIGWVSGNYNFNETLRCVTLMHERVTRDLDLPQLYLSLYTLRDALSKGIRREADPRIPLLDVFFKKVVNPRPQAFTIDKLRNYAKQHQLSSYEQMVVARAVEARIRVQEVFDSRFLENVFNVVDDGRSIRMDMMGDTQGSVNSSISSGLSHSVAEHSVDQTGAEEAEA